MTTTASCSNRMERPSRCRPIKPGEASFSMLSWGHWRCCAKSHRCTKFPTRRPNQQGPCSDSVVPQMRHCPSANFGQYAGLCHRHHQTHPEVPEFAGLGPYRESAVSAAKLSDLSSLRFLRSWGRTRKRTRSNRPQALTFDFTLWIDA